MDNGRRGALICALITTATSGDARKCRFVTDMENVYFASGEA